MILDTKSYAVPTNNQKCKWAYRTLKYGNGCHENPSQRTCLWFGPSYSKMVNQLRDVIGWRIVWSPAAITSDSSSNELSGEWKMNGKNRKHSPAQHAKTTPTNIYVIVRNSHTLLRMVQTRVPYFHIQINFFFCTYPVSC